jgi:hypothetical protein
MSDPNLNAGPETRERDRPRRAGRPHEGADLDQLADVVHRAVAEALREAATLPAHQHLAPEFRVVVTTKAGQVIEFAAEPETDARQRAESFTHSTAVIEHRLVSEWAAVRMPAPLRPGGSDGSQPGG